MESRHYWEENGLAVKYDNYNSNDGFGRANGEQGFAPPSEDETEYPAGAYLKKGKVSRQDPMSHRIIEKRRRDRMNNCLADLSRLIPPEYLKKGRGRVEKTEIIEMAIRHLKFLQERVNERQTGEENFRAGYQEAMGEAVRFLVEVQGHGPGDGLCVQLATHLQRHCELVTKGTYTLPREQHSRAGFQQAMGEALRFLAEEHGVGSDGMRVQLATHLQRHCELITNGEGHARDKQHSHLGSSSETASSSSSSQGYGLKGVIHRLEPPPGFAPEPYEPERTTDAQYAMECDRAIAPLPLASDARAQEPLALDARRKREPTLRKVRKLDHTEDYLHSYKFKNSIERRFSRSQDNEAAEVQARAHGKPYGHKRRRAGKPPPVASTSTSNSGSTEEARDTSPQDTSSESPHHHQFDVKAPAQYVPVFALNALGKYYVPLSVDYSCLARHLGPYDVLDARAVHLAAPLHPVTIHVNFQPCLNYHVKREPTDRDWRPV